MDCSLLQRPPETIVLYSDCPLWGFFFSTVRRLRLYACMYVYMYVRKNSSVADAVGHRIEYDRVVRPKFGVRLAFTSARSAPSPLHLCDARLGIQCTHTCLLQRVNVVNIVTRKYLAYNIEKYTVYFALMTENHVFATKFPRLQYLAFQRQLRLTSLSISILL